MITPALLRGLNDPFKFKWADGTKDTLFFDGDVVAAIKLRQNVVVPIWSDTPVFDQERLLAYKNFKRKFYSATEVDGHIDALQNMLHVGRNYCDGSYQLLGSELFHEYDIPEPGATISMLETFIRTFLDHASAAGNSLAISGKSSNAFIGDQFFKQLINWLVPDVQERVPYSHPFGMSDGQAYHLNTGLPGAMRIFHGNGPVPSFGPGYVVKAPWFCRDLVGINVVDSPYGSSTVQDTEGYYILDAVTVHIAVRDGTTITKKSYAFRRHMEATAINTSAYSFFSVTETPSEVASAFDMSLGVYNSLSGANATELPSSADYFALNGKHFPQAAERLGVCPWTSPAVRGLSNLPVPDVNGFIDLSDCNISGIVDIHKVANAYIEMAAYMDTPERREAMVSVGEGLLQTEQYRHVVAYTGRGISTRGSLSGTLLAQKAGDVDDIKPAVVSSTRPDGEEGPLTLGILDSTNLQEFADEAFLWGISFPVTPRKVNGYKTSQYRWVTNGSGSDFDLVQTADSAIVDRSFVEAEVASGRYPPVRFNSTVMRDAITASGLSPEEYLYTNFRYVFDNSTYGSAKDTSVGASTTYEVLPFFTDFYLSYSDIGLSPVKVKEFVESRLLVSALKARDVSKIAAIHVGGIIGWASLPSTQS